MQETWVQSLGWEDPLEEGIASHSSILAWRIPWTEEPGGLQSMELQKVVEDWVTKHTRGDLILGSPNCEIMKLCVLLYLTELQQEYGENPSSVVTLSFMFTTACVCAYMCVCAHMQSVQLWDPMDCSLPGSSVHEIFKARILEWVAISFSRGSFQPRRGTHLSCVSCIGRQVLDHTTTWEAFAIAQVGLF